MKLNYLVFTQLFIFLFSYFLIPEFVICGPFFYAIAWVLSLMIWVKFTDFDSYTLLSLAGAIIFVVHLITASFSPLTIYKTNLVVVTTDAVIETPYLFSKGNFESYGWSQNNFMIDTTDVSINLVGEFILNYEKKKSNAEFLSRKTVPDVDKYLSILLEKIRNGECTNPNLVLREKTQFGEITFKGNWSENVIIE